MGKLESRIQRIAEGLMGNESLLEMLEGTAASELLAWGLEISKAIASATAELGDDEAETAMGPRLRAVRQLLRSVGNWAAGQYRNPISQVQLRDSLLEQLRTIFGPKHPLPTPAQLEQALAAAGEGELDAPRLIRRLRLLIDSSIHGGLNDGS